MRTIRVNHEYDSEYGWYFDSPDMPGLIGGVPEDFDYSGARRHAEDAIRFFLRCDAEDQGESVPSNVEIVHLASAEPT